MLKYATKNRKVEIKNQGIKQKTINKIIDLIQTYQ